MTQPERRVVHAEALGWLAANPAPDACSVVTSLPDVSELPELGFEGWRRWFSEAGRQLIRWLPPAGLAIFYQSDIRHRGAWIDKGYLLQRAAEEEGAALVFHKIVCRKPAGTISHGRASYSHLLCFAQSERAAPAHPGPDVLPDAGFMPYSKAMGVDACRAACRFLLEETATKLVVDPFCGRGTILAVSNAMGFAALGIDHSIRKCRAARTLSITLD
jgi:hypothetical protein